MHITSSANCRFGVGAKGFCSAGFFPQMIRSTNGIAQRVHFPFLFKYTRFMMANCCIQGGGKTIFKHPGGSEFLMGAFVCTSSYATAGLMNFRSFTGGRFEIKSGRLPPCNDRVLPRPRASELKAAFFKKVLREPESIATNLLPSVPV
jgi:hypothetical protein